MIMFCIDFVLHLPKKTAFIERQLGSSCLPPSSLSLNNDVYFNTITFVSRQRSGLVEVAESLVDALFPSLNTSTFVAKGGIRHKQSLQTRTKILATMLIRWNHAGVCFSTHANKCPFNSCIDLS